MVIAPKDPGFLANKDRLSRIMGLRSAAGEKNGITGDRTAAKLVIRISANIRENINLALPGQEVWSRVYIAERPFATIRKRRGMTGIMNR